MRQVFCECGCRWELAVEATEFVSASLISCPMCFIKEEEEEVTDLTPKSKPVKEKKKHSISRKQNKWTEEVVDRLKELVSEGFSNKELTENLRTEFGMNVSAGQVGNILSRNRITRQKKKTEIEPELTHHEFNKNASSIEKGQKVRKKGFADEDIRIIENNYMDLSDEELRIKMGDETGHFFSIGKIQAYRETNGMIKPEGDDDWEEDDE